MIRHRIFSKGERIHALIHSTTNPNILFPVRGTIYDTKFDEYNPQYQIKVDKMYDDIAFLKRYLFKGRTLQNFEGKDSRWKFTRTNYKTTDEFVEKVFNGKNWEGYLIVVDSVYCCKTRKEQVDFFNKIQTFMVQKSLREVFQMVRRKEYRNGRFYYHTVDEFKRALKRFFGERSPQSDKWWNDFLASTDIRDLDKHV